MDIKELLAKIAEYDEMEAPDGMNLLEDIDNPYTVQEFHSDISDAIQALTEVQEMLAEEDENFDEPSLKAIRTAERLLECVKKFRADLLEQRSAAWNTPQPLTPEDEAAFGESVNETKDVDGNIVDYNFLVTVTMDAKNEVANDSLKSDIQKAIEDGLEKYDASIEVEDA